jgi:hypothetical protein
VSPRVNHNLRTDRALIETMLLLGCEVVFPARRNTEAEASAFRIPIAKIEF